MQQGGTGPHVGPVLRQYELLDKVRAYDPDADEALINRAYVFSMKAHGGQKRASGDPYYSHPIEVAGILTDLRLDDETIVTAILHDTIEDTVATPEEVERLFGKNVARMVVIKNEPGSLAVIAGILGGHGANIVSMNQFSRDGSFHTFHLDVEVHDVQHLMRILAALRATDVVSTAERL